jgi:hypothetical protein
MYCIRAIMSARTREIMRKLRELSDSDIAAKSQRFFKTGKGEYGKGGRIVRIDVAAMLLACLLLAGCGQPEQGDERTRVTEEKQTVSELTRDDNERLAQQRALVAAYLADDDSRRKYQTSAGKLGLLRALLQQKVFTSDKTYELQCMGVVLGDVFVQEMGMHWVMVQDEYGRNPAVQLEDTSIILFPLTMISKRVERGEEVDVFDLFNGFAAQIEEIRKVAE